MPLDHDELKHKADAMHDYDEDAVCMKCGFDGAEWHHWKHNTYEGRASNAKQPLCNNQYRRS